MGKLEERLGYRFQNPTLLRNALTHSSYANEHSVSSYERLEFLGDSILGMFVAEFLYENYPKLSEGELTRTRASLVCEDALVSVAEDLRLGTEIYLGKGEIARGARPSIRADVVEAILAAIYLDGGISPAKKMVSTYILSKNPSEFSGIKDFKTALQELIQQRPKQALSYQLLEERGPDHQKEFEVAVSVNEKTLGHGVGKSKKEAEQQAAKTAYLTLKKR